MRFSHDQNKGRSSVSKMRDRNATEVWNAAADAKEKEWFWIHLCVGTLTRWLFKGFPSMSKMRKQESVPLVLRNLRRARRHRTGKNIKSFQVHKVLLFLDRTILKRWLLTWGFFCLRIKSKKIAAKESAKQRSRALNQPHENRISREVSLLRIRPYFEQNVAGISQTDDY